MGHPAVSIPEKIFFKIGEVCEIVDVQAHVLRYWETEFPMLAPQKNRSGQRSYRRRDVEVALRIKELLYEEQYTIAGAKKKLQTDTREGAKLKIVPPGPEIESSELSENGLLFDDDIGALDLEIDDDSDELRTESAPSSSVPMDKRQAIEELANTILELRKMLADKKF
mgnify:CR=1 FL=1